MPRSKRRVERFPVQRPRCEKAAHSILAISSSSIPAISFWTGLELYARAFRGELGAEQKKVVEERLKIEPGRRARWPMVSRADGVYQSGGPMLWVTTIWSPQAGYNPVSKVMAHDKPDGKLESKIEWQWKVIDGIYVPSTIKESAYRRHRRRAVEGARDRSSRNASLNRPLGPPPVR